MPLFVHNTLSKQLQAFSPRDRSRIGFYSCGPTVYDDAHIGNFRSFLAGDLLRRWLESALCEVSGPDGAVHSGPRTVVHVMNITDVGHMTDDAAADGAGEDKMAVAGRRLAEAKKAGTLPPGVEVDASDPYAIASFYADRFLEDARRLGLKVAIEAAEDPSLMPRATGAVGSMVRIIERLIDRGHAYVVGEGAERAVYFDVRSFATYGALSGNTLDGLVSGKGGRVSETNQAQKRHPADFLLWKSDPSHVMKWDSPWGAGYPGWHIECTAMSFDRLVRAEGRAGDDALFADATALIDVHSGGEDNIFPHHECEIAQSCCAFNETPAGAPFATLWFHPRHLLVEGEKMSKRRGNFFTARELFERGHDPAAIRLELIKTHYRTNANFTDRGLRDSARMVERWRSFASAPRPGEAGERTAEMLRAFASEMHNDLNIAGALGAVNAWMHEVGEPTEGDVSALRTVDEVIGVLSLERGESRETEIGLFAPGVEPDDEVIAKLVERREARASKDFSRADEIRDELMAMGYAIKDAPGGKVEVSRAR